MFEISPVPRPFQLAMEVGKRMYEFANHLGNVLNVITDRKLAVEGSPDEVDYYTADVISYSDYYPFGMMLPGRNGSAEDYRYGFSGMEKDNEISGEGNSYNFEARFYNPRVGRMLSADPAERNNPSQSTFVYAGNNPVFFKDNDGESAIAYFNDQGQLVISATVVLYTGDKTVYDKIDVNALEAKYIQMTSTVMAQDADGNWVEGKPTYTMPNGTIVDVVFEIEVNKVYDESFNEPLETPDDARAWTENFKAGIPDAAATSDGVTRPRTSLNVAPRDIYNNFVRVEDWPMVSNFYTNQNTGAWSIDDILDENGNPNTGIAHELLYHGIIGLPHVDEASIIPGDYGGHLPIGIPKKGHPGGSIDESKRMVYQYEINKLPITGITFNNTAANPFTIGSNSMDNMQMEFGQDAEVLNLTDKSMNSLGANMKP